MTTDMKCTPKQGFWGKGLLSEVMLKWVVPAYTGL